MKIRSIDFDEDEEPRSVVVEMSLHEAAMMAVMTGKLSLNTADEIIPDGYTASGGIYDCLVGSLFNRFWDDGVNSYLGRD